MLRFPNAKINLGLSVVEKRSDGYHNLETVFYPIGWKDALEITPATDEQTLPIELHLSGQALAGNPQDNLVVKAYHLLRQDFDLTPITVHLCKQIPSGAGLGGGSSDAAFMLRMLNDMHQLQLTDEALEAYAAQLGADCPFFVRNQAVFAEGIGDVFSPISCSLTGNRLVVVKPSNFISTKEAFSNIRPHRPSHSVKEVVTQCPLADWKTYLKNDFEASVIPLHPAIGRIKAQLYEQGAIYASMSGSGSAVFGIFPLSAIPSIEVFPADAEIFTESL